MTHNPFTDHDWLLDEQVTPVHHHESTFLCSLNPGEEVEDATILGSPAQVSHASRAAKADAVEAATGERPRAHLSRRGVLRGGAGAGLGALMVASATPRYAFAATPTAPRDTIVAIFMRGAMDTLSALVPHGDPAYYAARPSVAVAKGQVIDLDGFFGLHPQLAPLMPAWTAGELGFVHATGNTDPTRSHFAAQDNVERAAPANIRSGWLGRHLETSSTTQGTFRAITLGPRATASLAAPFPTLSMTSVADFDLRASATYKPNVMRDLDAMFGDAGGAMSAQADAAFTAVDRLATLRAQTYKPAGGAVYPDTAFGRNMAEIARVIKAGLGVEVACVDLGNWDMHNNMGTATNPDGWMSRQLRDLALTLAAFRTDLGAHFAKTLVVTMTEFGRRVAENSTGGLDHGHGQAMFFMGGGIVGKKVHGRWPGLDKAALDAGDLAIATDYRHPLAEVVSRRLSNPRVDQVFPGFTPTALGLAR